MTRGNILLSTLLWSVIALFVLYPLSILMVESFKIAGTDSWGINNYLEFFQDAYYLKTFGNTLYLSTLVLLTTTLFGIPLAYILARYRQRGKTIFTALILLPIVLPAYAGVFAFIIFFGKYGTVNLLLLETGVVGVFVSLDLFLFYIFWEVMLIPMYLLIGVWGSPDRRIYAAVKFFLYTMFGSLLMLVAILVICFYHYRVTGF